MTDELEQARQIVAKRCMTGTNCTPESIFCWCREAAREILAINEARVKAERETAAADSARLSLGFGELAGRCHERDLTISSLRERATRAEALQDLAYANGVKFALIAHNGGASDEDIMKRASSRQSEAIKVLKATRAPVCCEEDVEARVARAEQGKALAEEEYQLQHYELRNARERTESAEARATRAEAQVKRLVEAAQPFARAAQCHAIRPNPHPIREKNIVEGLIWSYADGDNRYELSPLDLRRIAAVLADIAKEPQAPDGGLLCSDCPPAGYPTERTRCEDCPRRAADIAKEG